MPIHINQYRSRHGSERTSMFRKMMLVGTAPRGGEDIMRLEKPTLAKLS
jgi:hypothetical protein